MHQRAATFRNVRPVPEERDGDAIGEAAVVRSSKWLPAEGGRGKWAHRALSPGRRCREGQPDPTSKSSTSFEHAHSARMAPHLGGDDHPAGGRGRCQGQPQLWTRGEDHLADGRVLPAARSVSRTLNHTRNSAPSFQALEDTVMPRTGSIAAQMHRIGGGRLGQSHERRARKNPVATTLPLSDNIRVGGRSEAVFLSSRYRWRR